MGNRPLAAADAPNLPRSDDTTLRLLTYNVHSCVGTDGAYNFKRVGRVAASVNPDGLHSSVRTFLPFTCTSLSHTRIQVITNPMLTPASSL